MFLAFVATGNGSSLPVNFPHTRQAAIAQPLGRSQQRQHAAERKAHHGQQQRKPAGIGMRAVHAYPAEHRCRQQRGQAANHQDPDARAQQLDRAASGIGLTGRGPPS